MLFLFYHSHRIMIMSSSLLSLSLSILLSMLLLWQNYSIVGSVQMSNMQIFGSVVRYIRRAMPEMYMHARK